MQAYASGTKISSVSNAQASESSEGLLKLKAAHHRCIRGTLRALVIANSIDVEKGHAELRESIDILHLSMIDIETSFDCIIGRQRTRCGALPA